jgi:hypothetical protein
LLQIHLTVASLFLNSLAEGLKMAIEKPLGQRLIQFAGFFALLVFLTFRYGLESVEAARVSDIRGTKHNLSSTSSGTIKATSETQVCVFCHTPHGAPSPASDGKPLWNRKVEGNPLYSQNYVLYDSSTLDAKQVQGSLQQPGGSSKLCLSCHDGTVAVGNVNVLSGLNKSSDAKTVATIPTTGGTFMPTGSGATTGFTRNLGTDLSNDHPISISYNDALANRDGELRYPSSNPTIMGLRTTTNKPKLKLEATGTAGDNLAQIQCATCHDPHIRETDTSVGNQKFLRLNRFQHKSYSVAPSGFDATDNTGDIICLACHDKAGASWTFSAHAHPDVADETYTPTAANQREFPTTLKVWQAACLNCHDTHTVQGSRRLLREGTDSLSTPKTGGNPALEQTCYQCHGISSALSGGTDGAPNIESDFALAKAMPLKVGSPEVHNPDSTAVNTVNSFGLDCITAGTRCGKDLIEGRGNLGVGNLSNRHAECTDCHNPHRVIRARNGLPGPLTALNTKDPKTVANGGASGGSHRHEDATGYTHSNVISGVLRGSWGVEPTYGSKSFHALPTGYDIKRGDPGNASATDAAQTYVTREYQICMKCHSDYGYSDNNVHSSSTGNRPLVGAAGTLSGTNGLTMYTNQAKEFQAPSGHEGGSSGKAVGTEGGAASYANNHRSWHPVMKPTGRTGALRGVTATSAWRTPWSNALGTQTMYCTDCHGSGTTGNTVIPAADKPWGPHGSTNNFILKGTWDKDSNQTTAFCIKCHSPTSSSGFFNPKDTGGNTSGGQDKGNLHAFHNTKVPGLQCTWCHVAVPHGWKNRSFLVNLNDIGEEAGYAANSSFEVAMRSTNESNAGGNDNYSKEPYYLEAKLNILTFAAPGLWMVGNCGSAGKTTIAASNGNTANGVSSGRQWMKSVCNAPP